MVALIFTERCNGCAWCLDVCPHQIIVLDENERAEILISLKPVDYVIVFNETTPEYMLSEFQPDIH